MGNSVVKVVGKYVSGWKVVGKVVWKCIIKVDNRSGCRIEDQKSSEKGVVNGSSDSFTTDVAS